MGSGVGNWGSNMVSSGVGNWGSNMGSGVGNWSSNVVSSGVGNWVDQSTGVDKSGISLSFSLGNSVGDWNIVDRDDWGVCQSRVGSWDTSNNMMSSGVGNWGSNMGSSVGNWSSNSSD